jgi:hypothetical protein
MGLLTFLGLASENGPCSDCTHGYQMGGSCRFFAREEYSRVHGTNTVYGDCEQLRSSGGKCGPSGNYWQQADKRTHQERMDDERSQRPDTSFPGDSNN